MNLSYNQIIKPMNLFSYLLIINTNFNVQNKFCQANKSIFLS